MKTYQTLANYTAQDGDIVLLRADLNVPVKDGAVSDDTRLVRLLPTLKALQNKGVRVAILSHFGRPKGVDVTQSLRPVAAHLAQLLHTNIAFAEDCIGDAPKNILANLPQGGLCVLENLRFHAGEEKNDPAFVQQLAALGTVFVNDAFSASHRAHASIVGLAQALPAYAGLLMEAELTALDKALGTPKPPLLALVGGAKISTKLELLGNLVGKVNMLALGGGMANTFLAAQGVAMGKSLVEADMLPQARAIMAKAQSQGCEIILPIDGRVAKSFSADAPHHEVRNADIAADDMVLDIGPQSIRNIILAVQRAKTVLWNGPLGAFELPPFAVGTIKVAESVAEASKAGTLLSVAGGGDTVAALEAAGTVADFSYVSTAGGAFLEWLEGKELPGISALIHAA